MIWLSGRQDHGLSLPGAGKQDAGTLRPCFYPLHPVLWLQSTKYSNMVSSEWEGHAASNASFLEGREMSSVKRSEATCLHFGLFLLILALLLHCEKKGSR